MVKTLTSAVPDVDSSLVLTTGAAELRSVFTPEQIPGIIQAYVAGLRIVWAITIGFAGCAFVVGLLSRWERLYHTSESGSAKEPTTTA